MEKWLKQLFFSEIIRSNKCALSTTIILSNYQNTQLRVPAISWQVILWFQEKINSH